MAVPRIKCFQYQGAWAYFVTLCCENRKSFFENSKNVSLVLKELKQGAKIYSFKVWAFCFMPDHLHFLIQGIKNNSDFLNFINFFKQRSAYYFKKMTGENLWQKGYFERILRQDEDLLKVSSYIFQNPVRAKIVKCFKEYPYSGSFVFDLNDF